MDYRVTLAVKQSWYHYAGSEVIWYGDSLETIEQLVQDFASENGEFYATVETRTQQQIWETVEEGVHNENPNLN
jgi:hypothetical protein